MKRFVAIIIGVFLCCVAYADTETINWYVGNDSYAQTTCETGTDIILPTTPTKRGHTFDGWVVPLYDLSTLDADIDGTKITKDETTKTWSVVFPYGTLYAVSLCSATANGANPPDESTPDGPYCWLKVTEYKPFGAMGITYKNISPVWVFSHYYGSGGCPGNCVTYSSYDLFDNISCRRKAFGITQ